MKVRLQLYTVPGQVFYNATRRLVLKGVDGVVFVADSQVPAQEPNEESLANLRQNLEELGIDPREVPSVFQYNKRDLRNILPVETLQKVLNPGGAPAFEAAAIHGVGVFETLKEISRLSLDSIRARVADEGRRGVAGKGGGTVRGESPPSPGGPPPSGGQPEATQPPAPPAAEPPPAPTPAAPDPATLEPLRVEFAEEDTDKVTVRPVRTHGIPDIGRELEKLRAITAEGKMKTPTAVRDGDVDRLFRSLVSGARGTEQELVRKASLEVPEHLMKGLTELRIHLGFDRDGREEIVRDAVRVTLARTRILQQLRLRLELDLKGKD